MMVMMMTMTMMIISPATQLRSSRQELVQVQRGLGCSLQQGAVRHGFERRRWGRDTRLTHV